MNTSIDNAINGLINYVKEKIFGGEKFWKPEHNFAKFSSHLSATIHHINDILV